VAGAVCALLPLLLGAAGGGSRGEGELDSVVSKVSADELTAWKDLDFRDPASVASEKQIVGTSDVILDTPGVTAGTVDSTSDVASGSEYSADFGPPGTRSFYMYRAQSDKDYPLENINTGNLAGVMWYLHNEIVPFTPRKYNISRIMRLRVTVENPTAWTSAHGTQFGDYVAFDRGQCTVPNCQHTWDTYGPVVGCQSANAQVANYRSGFTTMAKCSQSSQARPCDAPVWWSLPGACPALNLDAKTSECRSQTPGGLCPDEYSVNGKDCTYFAHWAGEVLLDELTGIDYAAFQKAGYQEYDKNTDKGHGTDFWNGIHNQTAGERRMKQLMQWFKYKYPMYHDLDEPICDAP